MSRKDAILNMRQILIKRRDALRKALAGDLSLLKELRAQTSGDMVDAALDSVQDEISSQLAEVESRELGPHRVRPGADARRAVRHLRRLRDQHPHGPAECPALRHVLHQVPARGGTPRRRIGRRRRLEPLARFRAGDAELSINDIEIDVS